MKTFAQIALTAIVAALLSSCGGGASHEELADEMMGLMEEYADAIGSIKDEASADKAAEELEKIGGRMQELAERAQEMPDPSPEVQARIDKKMEEKEKALIGKIMGAMAPLAANPELLKRIEPAMAKIQAIMPAG